MVPPAPVKRLDEGLRQTLAVGVLQRQDGGGLVAVHADQAGRGRRPGTCPAARCGSRGPCPRTSDSAIEVLAGEIWTTPAAGDLVDDVSDTEDEAAPTMASTPLARSGSRRSARRCWSTCRRSHRRSFTTGLPRTPPASLISLSGEVDACELGRAEEGERAGLREQRADLQRAVAGRATAVRRARTAVCRSRCCCCHRRRAASAEAPATASDRTRVGRVHEDVSFYHGAAGVPAGCRGSGGATSCNALTLPGAI